MITVIDYGMGNIGALTNMIEYVGYKTKISSDPNEIRKARKIILPGVGRMDVAMKLINKIGIDDAIKEASENIDIKILGICLGMQMLFEESEEGNSKGIGLIKGRVKKFNFKGKELKIPHMGWNNISIKKKDTILGDKISQRYYFVHSYYVECSDYKDIVATTEYGYDFVSAVKKKNIFAIQFHPEKSHKDGINFFKNFVKDTND